MHHIFMLIVILALLPAAIATALALGQILFYALIAVAILGGVLFLIINPDVFLGLIGAALILAALIVAGYAVMWGAARLERKQPGMLHRLGYGSGALLAACAGIAFALDSVKRDVPLGEVFALFLIFSLIAGVLGWWAMKAKPTDTSKWFRV